MVRRQHGSGERLREFAGAAIAAVTVTGLALAGGGYAPTAWGWTSVPLFATAGAAALAANRRPPWAVVLLSALVAAAAALAAVSTLWSASPTLTLLDAERSLVYAAFVGAIAAVAAGSTRALPLAVVGAATAVAADNLARHILPGTLGPADPALPGATALPIGYANGLGGLVAIGAVVAIAIGAHASSPAAGAAAAAALLVLLPTLALTRSAGALLAAAAGITVWLALVADRTRVASAALLAVLVPAAPAVVVARSDALVALRPAAQAATAGHRLGLILLALLPLALLCGTLIPRLRRRLAAGRERRARDVATAAAVVAAAVVAALVLSLGDNERRHYWPVALAQLASHPLIGGGAGTFVLEWQRERPVALDARDAHSLYLEAAGELGPAGAALMLAIAVLPLAAAARSRHPAAAAAAAGWTVYAVHAGLDFDWELPAVTCAGLACAAAACTGAPRHGGRIVTRVGVSAVALVAAAAAAVALAGNRAVAGSASALRAGNTAGAIRSARHGATLAPWSSRPRARLAFALLAAGDDAGARRAFLAALERDPRRPELWRDLAAITTRRTRCAALRRAQRLDPLGTAAARSGAGAAPAPDGCTQATTASTR